MFVKGVDSVNLDPKILNQDAYMYLCNFMLTIQITYMTFITVLIHVNYRH